MILVGIISRDLFYIKIIFKNNILKIAENRCYMFSTQLINNK